MGTSFESIYKNNYEKLYTLSFRLTGNREDAEDVLQIAFLNACKAFDKFRGDADIATWLYRIVINASRKFWKDAAKLPADSYAEETGQSLESVFDHINSYGTVEDTVLVNQIRESCLQMFMNCMPAIYRAVFTLRVILGFTVKEVMEILELSESSVKVTLHRARKTAASHFNGWCSLVKPGAMCSCRSFAGYLRENGKTGKLLDIEIIQGREKTAREKYEKEISDILKIDRLYCNRIKPVDYSRFIGHVKELARSGNNKLINIPGINIQGQKKSTVH